MQQRSSTPYRRQHQQPAPIHRQHRKSKAPRIVAIVAVVIVLVVCFFAFNSVTVILNGDAEMTLEVNATFEDPGATAEFEAFLGAHKTPLDASAIEVEGTVDSTQPGDYEIVYTAKHHFWHGSATRVVHVEDVTPPVITLAGGTLYVCDDPNTWEELGYTAVDDLDGDVTDQVQRTVEGNTVTYTVTDKAGNTATATRTLTTEIPDTKVVYLTFDDGPSQYTQQLLDVCAKHGAKVTFFVTNNGDASLIKKEFEAGHSIGVHTSTHNYDKVYASEDAFWEDFEAMEKTIKEQTGWRTNLCRFPGGSSNTVSKITPGIMTKLTKKMDEKGLVYFDWNVSSGDASGTPLSTEQIRDNIIAGIQQNNASVVLQHDTNGNSVAAVDAVLTWGEQNGYVFLALHEDSPTAHHPVNN